MNHASLWRQEYGVFGQTSNLLPSDNGHCSHAGWNKGWWQKKIYWALMLDLGWYLDQQDDCIFLLPRCLFRDCLLNNDKAKHAQRWLAAQNYTKIQTIQKYTRKWLAEQLNHRRREEFIVKQNQLCSRDIVRLRLGNIPQCHPGALTHNQRPLS